MSAAGNYEVGDLVNADRYFADETKSALALLSWIDAVHFGDAGTLTYDVSVHYMQRDGGLVAGLNATGKLIVFIA